MDRNRRMEYYSKTYSGEKNTTVNQSEALCSSWTQTPPCRHGLLWRTIAHLSLQWRLKNTHHQQCESDEISMKPRKCHKNCQERLWSVVKTASVTVEVPVSRFDLSVGRHEGVCLLHHAAGKVANASFLLSIIRILHAASPEEIPSVFEQSVNIDNLALPDGDEPAVSWVVVLQRTSYQDRIAAFSVGADLLVGQFRHLFPSLGRCQQEPQWKRGHQFESHDFIRKDPQWCRNLLL